MAEAVKHFERALQVKPDYPLARGNLEKARAAAAAATVSPDQPRP